MKVYGPPQSKINNIKSNNPTYFALLVSRSQYTQDEIEETLLNIDQVNSNLMALLEKAYDYLVWEDGEPMDYIHNGFATDAHKALNRALAAVDYMTPSMSENSHLNCFPVKKWQKEMVTLKNKMGKIEKQISSL